MPKRKPRGSGPQPNFGGMSPNAGSGGMNNLMSQMQKLQDEMEKAQDGLADEEVTGSAGGGMVTVVATGKQEIRSIKIKPEAVDPDDVEMLEDLVLAAVADALQKSHELAEERMSGLTSGMGLPPGLGF